MAKCVIELLSFAVTPLHTPLYLFVMCVCVFVCAYWHVCIELALQQGWTALMYGSFDGHSSCLTLLIQRGALVDAKDLVRITIDVACAYIEGDISYEYMRCGYCDNFSFI